jgi:Lipoprotein NlpI, contains TPR repeats
VAYYNRGEAYQAKRDYDRAIYDFDQAIKINPNYEAAYYNRGLTYSSKRDFERAIADFGQVIRLEPKNPLAFYNRASPIRTRAI